MDTETDALGLDQPLKLGRVSRIPKITDELIFENHRGLPQVRNNYTKLVKSMRKNDKTLAKNIAKQGRNASKSLLKQQKIDTEVANLEKVLSFYQLWCHGLFPRANFKDCLKMLRNHNSFALKEYRRGLINNELKRLRIEKGIIVEEPEEEHEENDQNEQNDPEMDGMDEDLYAPANLGDGDENELPAVAIPDAGSGIFDDDDDDWGFSALRGRKNRLFVGADDDEDEENEENEENGNENNNRNEESTNAAHQTISSAHPDDEFPDDDDFADINSSFAPNFDETQIEENDNHDEELAIMREMGM